MKNVFPKLISDTIIEIPGSPVIIVGLAELDNIQYGAFVDLSQLDPITEKYKGYINEVRLNKTKDTFLDSYSIYDNEEWQVISNFFDKSGIFEMNRIDRWLWAKINGLELIPKWMYEQADKKRRKVVGMKRSKKTINLSTPQEREKILDIKWNPNA